MARPDAVEEWTDDKVCIDGEWFTLEQRAGGVYSPDDGVQSLILIDWRRRALVLDDRLSPLKAVGVYRLAVCEIRHILAGDRRGGRSVGRGRRGGAARTRACRLDSVLTARELAMVRQTGNAGRVPRGRCIRPRKKAAPIDQPILMLAGERDGRAAEGAA